VTLSHRINAAARDFAQSLKELLNRTVCNGAHIASAVRPGEAVAVVGTNLVPRLMDTSPVRLRTPRASFCWLNLVCRLYHDDRGFVTVLHSTFEISTGRNAEDELFRYDYERDKTPYAEAHIQVNARSEPLERLLADIGKPDRRLRHLHLPVGGRRFRPALEDVLEALIHEEVILPSTGWKDILDKSRETFRDNQLRAAIARSPKIAAEVLTRQGYQVHEPEDDPAHASTGARLFVFRRRR
jgi:hypothetical protein